MDPIIPKPSEQDRKNYSRPLRESQFFDKPGDFLKEGDRVRAKFRIWDAPNMEAESWGWISADAGDEGVCVGSEPGYWPTVRFEKTGFATCVTDFEVEII